MFPIEEKMPPNKIDEYLNLYLEEVFDSGGIAQRVIDIFTSGTMTYSDYKFFINIEDLIEEIIPLQIETSNE